MSEVTGVNKFFGLWAGPIDNNASSVINAIWDTQGTQRAVIGDSVIIKLSPSTELLPQIFFTSTFTVDQFYGIIIGGDRKGEYPINGQTLTFLVTDKTTVGLPGDTVRVCTQGRCIARTNILPTAINVGDPLTPANQAGELRKATTSGDNVIARALQPLAINNNSLIFNFLAIDIKREGKLP